MALIGYLILLAKLLYDQNVKTKKIKHAVNDNLF